MLGDFYVILQTDVHLYTGDRLMFDTVVHSPGNDFILSGGHYRCPADGMYVLMSTITAGEQFGSVSFGLKQNGLIQLPRVTPRNKYNQVHSGSAFWIIQCAATNQVYLEVLFDNKNTGLLVKGDGFSMFSGFLLTTDLE